jgi:mannan endo-1,4-beta-mannosidase
MATHATLYTSGRYLYGRDGKQITLRGINYPLLDDWNFPGKDALAEIAKTGANALRIQWYVNYGSPDRPKYSLTDLDNFLLRCATAGMIPILMLSDLTCASDANLVNTQLIPWWTSAKVIKVLQKHAKYLIINIANEVGFYRWADDPNAALASYAAAYATAIASMRKAGLIVPLMIDAPDCGTSLDAFLTIGQQLITADPSHNLLLSAHAYWAAYAGIPFIQKCITAKLPIVFAEVANKQDESIEGNTVYCYYDLDGTHTNLGPTNGFTYQSLLTLLQKDTVSWLVWSWGPDNCAARQLSTNSTFASLTPFGNDIVNNPLYGLIATSHRSKLL